MAFKKGVIAAVGLYMMTFAAGPVATASARGGQGGGEGDQDPTIGTWTLNLGKSDFMADAPPRAIWRTFSEARDGLILVTYEILNAQGNWVFLHWHIDPSGTPQPEFLRGRKEPLTHLSIKEIDAYTKEMTNPGREDRRYGVFTVSKDRQTLTMTYKNVDRETTRVAVYDRVW